MICSCASSHTPLIHKKLVNFLMKASFSLCVLFTWIAVLVALGLPVLETLSSSSSPHLTTKQLGPLILKFSRHKLPKSQTTQVFLLGTCFLRAHDTELSWSRADSVGNPSRPPPLSASGCSPRRVHGCTPWHWATTSRPKHGPSASTSPGCPCGPEAECGRTSYTWREV